MKRYHHDVNLERERVQCRNVARVKWERGARLVLAGIKLFRMRHRKAKKAEAQLFAVQPVAFENRRRECRRNIFAGADMRSAPDVEMLGELAKISAAAHCPFISGASPTVMQMDSWQELANPRDLSKLFTNTEYAAWRSLRQSEDARYIGLTMPRFLARMPYGTRTNPVDEFDFGVVLDRVGQIGQHAVERHRHGALCQ